MLKGSNLRNTDFVYGVVVYTGHHTKVMMNSAKPRRKLSDLESLMNKSILIILVAQFILALIAAITGTALTVRNMDSVRYWYESSPRNGAGQSNVMLFIQLFGSWILMLTNFVPISLIVTLELVKFWQGMFMSYDFLMFDQE